MTATKEPAPYVWCICGTEKLFTRNADGTFIDEMRCPGCERVWKLAKLSSGTPIWTHTDTHSRREGEGSCYRRMHTRYMTCAERVWDLFDQDPLPADCAAQTWIERLEALLEHGLLAPAARPRLNDGVCPGCWGSGCLDRKPCERCGGSGRAKPKLRGVPCPDCHGGGGARCGTRPCARCGGSGETP